MKDWILTLQIANLSKQIYSTKDKDLINKFDEFLINGERLSKNEVYQEVVRFNQLL